MRDWQIAEHRVNVLLQCARPLRGVLVARPTGLVGVYILLGTLPECQVWNRSGVEQGGDAGAIVGDLAVLQSLDARQQFLDAAHSLLWQRRCDAKLGRSDTSGLIFGHRLRGVIAR
jgi:hypothetical protein